MYRKKECVAMLLAGGRGSRLYVLTKKVAKPAVPFGGKYRIIDFPLSNCVNSGIDTVGVLTQYEPHVLNAYIGSGQTWDLDRLRGGVSVLPPYQRGKASEWYKGTANAIYQNIPFIADYDPEYVLILSGDHIYKMDYNKMLRQHKETGADATIAVLDVPLSEASRFGIMNCKPDGQIYGLLGPNGAGKSTIMNILTGYLAPTEGEVKVAGFRLPEQAQQAKACVGYLPEQPPLYPEMTVQEYLDFVAELKGVKHAQRKQQVLAAARRTGLEEVLPRVIRSLSKGYRQRVGIAQALLGSPQLIILADPTVGLAPAQVIEIRNLIRALG